MYEHNTYEAVRDRMLARVPDKFDKREGSVIWDTHSPTAAEFQILYIELEYLIKNSYGDTAARDFLVLLAKDRGLAPQPATKAILKGEFVPADIDVAGKRFNIGDMNYTVLEQICPGQYQVQCEKAGAAGNQFLGEMIPVDYISGLQSAQLTELLIPGEEDEDTEVFRQRYLDSFNEQSFGGNRADYLSKVRKMDGVGDCKVTSVWNGDICPAELMPGAKVTEWYDSVIAGLDAEAAAWLSAVYTAARDKKLTVGGTVMVTLVNAMDYGEAGSALLDKVQSAIDPEANAGEGYGLAPIGHVVKVKSAAPHEITVRTTLTFDEGYSWSNLGTPIREAVSAYLMELRKSWAQSTSIIVRLSQIETRILSVKGVADISGTLLNGTAANLTLGEFEIPVLGGVSA